MARNPQGMLAVARSASMGALRRIAIWTGLVFTGSALLVAVVAWLAGGARVALTGETLAVGVALGAALGYAAGFIALLFEVAHVVERRQHDVRMGS